MAILRIVYTLYIHIVKKRDFIMTDMTVLTQWMNNPPKDYFPNNCLSDSWVQPHTNMFTNININYSQPSVGDYMMNSLTMGAGIGLGALLGKGLVGLFSHKHNYNSNMNFNSFGFNANQSIFGSNWGINLPTNPMILTQPTTHINPAQG